MLTYNIISKELPQSLQKQPKQLKPEDPNYMENVFRRSYVANYRNFTTGVRVKIRGTPRRGVVVKTTDDIKEVNWIRNRPHYIYVKLDDGAEYVANPGQLKRYGNK